MIKKEVPGGWTELPANDVEDADEGARMMTNIVTDDVEAVRIGQRVVVHFDAVTDDVTLPKFKLA